MTYAVLSEQSSPTSAVEKVTQRTVATYYTLRNTATPPTHLLSRVSLAKSGSSLALVFPLFPPLTGIGLTSINSVGVACISSVRVWLPVGRLRTKALAKDERRV